MPSDHLDTAADDHFVDVAPDENLAIAVGDGNGVIVALVSYQRQRSPLRDVDHRAHGEPVATPAVPRRHARAARRSSPCGGAADRPGSRR